MNTEQQRVAFELAPARFADLALLERELRVSHVLAQVLARRGLSEPAAARAFLAAEECHSPRAFRGIGAAVELVLGHVERGSVITVHGDYDCDGVCSTAILVGQLRALGADVDWYLPDRVADGYGLALATVARLASRGTRLLIAADCGITAIEPVAGARAAGMDVLVTDHHAPRADGALPGAPLVHPALCGYPSAQLCATAVAAKLAQALRAAAGLDDSESAAELELVALATVTDVVPLLGENRRLVRAGLRAMASTARPGLRALMRVAQVDPLRVDERALGFRIGPRINAAGRMQRADSALELLLTADEARAVELADELDHLNAERRHAETRIRFEAEAQVAASGPASAYVLAGEDWHPGVIGIVAARIAERHGRPAVLLALGEEVAVGSARSIPAFDLLAGLEAAAAELVTWGGHRAAAGLQVELAKIDAFRAAFVAHAERELAQHDLTPHERVDAIIDGGDVGLALAEELASLAPFGAANPAVSLLLRAATIEDVAGFGGERRGDHARFTITAGGGRARAVAFGSGTRLGVEPGIPVDAAFALERNEWQGVVEPRLVLRALAACAPQQVTIVGEPPDYLACALGELERDLAPAPAGVASAPQREPRDRRGRGVAATIAGLVATGEPVLVLCAAASERQRHMAGRLGGFALCSYAALERNPEIESPYMHLVLLDPPASEQQLALAHCGNGFTHLAWGEPELRFAVHIHGREYQLRDPLAACYRSLRDLEGAAGERLERVLRGDAPQGHSPELAGRLLRVLSELELITVDAPGRAARVTSTASTSLDRSPAFVAYSQRLQDGLRFLEPSKEQAA
ncbi:MAG: single-stranded-DNA-specific exonuclease RecJ [Solirubrobacteraceae bacterium]|jgi:single-stranded-DNA-specific exonuclease